MTSDDDKKTPAKNEVSRRDMLKNAGIGRGWIGSYQHKSGASDS